ncbi:hypothetical protein K502DRAFT_342314 [Neoconidiobolus thromboides FSU 785]|nr:hypothetical protein K502DRAFT_342314 [Neoconidiobolus thromboides FSU 785]
MSLALGYSSSSEEENEKIKVNSKNQIILTKPKKIEDSDEETESKPIAIKLKPQLHFTKLKSTSRGSKLFDILPEVKVVEEDEGAEKWKEDKGIVPKEIKKEVIKETAFIPNSIKKKVNSHIQKQVEEKKEEELGIDSLFPIDPESFNNYADESKIEELSRPITSEQEYHETNTAIDEVAYYQTNEIYRVDKDNLHAQQYFRDQIADELEDTIYNGSKKELEELKNMQNMQEIDLNQELNDEESIGNLTKGKDIQPEFNINRHQLPSIGKRRYNIVYLANQAKSRDQELQDYYNKNKKTRNEAKKRYGF